MFRRTCKLIYEIFDFNRFLFHFGQVNVFASKVECFKCRTPRPEPRGAGQGGGWGGDGGGSGGGGGGWGGGEDGEFRDEGRWREARC